MRGTRHGSFPITLLSLVRELREPISGNSFISHYPPPPPNTHTHTLTTTASMVLRLGHLYVFLSDYGQGADARSPTLAFSGCLFIPANRNCHGGPILVHLCVSPGQLPCSGGFMTQRSRKRFCFLFFVFFIFLFRVAFHLL